ncbi:MAG: class I SAM-dependent RNA methyltransferase, partial [Oscillospiraceae bacterium]|nr:class I SAM-dependent RNA methyltransferase [Candidatus Equicaccousia limihippi]
MINKNEQFEIDITDVSKEGSGIGHYNGFAVFVLGALTGDRVLCHVILAKKNYCIAKIVKMITPSPARIESDCDVSRSCGGCTYRELNYKKELDIKAETVTETLRRIGKIKCEKKAVIGGERSHYRNKASFKIDAEFNLGFYAQNTHRIVKVKHCPVLPEIFFDIADIFENWGKENNLSVYDEKIKSGLVRGLMLREGKDTGEILVTVIVNGRNLPFFEKLITELKNLLGERLKGVVLNINTADTNVILGKDEKVLFGQNYITDILCNKKFNISSRSFY